MMNRVMGKMAEVMAPGGVRFVAPMMSYEKGVLSDQVIGQMRRDFMVAAPFIAHTPVPELFAASWLVIRESLLVGNERTLKEQIAVAIASHNECPFCVTAHRAAVLAAGETAESTQIDLLVEWVRFHSVAQEPRAKLPAPFSTHDNTELFSTAVAFQYLTRVVCVLLEEKMMPLPNFMSGAGNCMAKMMMGGMLKKPSVPGAALELLPEPPDNAGWRPEWAKQDTRIEQTLATWSYTIDQVAAVHFPHTFLDRLATELRTWDGQTILLNNTETVQSLKQDLPENLHNAVELGLNIGTAAYRVTDQQISQFRSDGNSDACLVALVSWCSAQAAQRFGDSIVVAPIKPPSQSYGSQHKAKHVSSEAN